MESILGNSKTFDMLYYFADHPECKRQILNSQLFAEKLEKAFFAVKRLQFRDMTSYFISAHLLLLLHHRSHSKKEEVLVHLRKRVKDLPEDSFTAKRNKTLPVCTVYHIITIETEHGLELPQGRLKNLLEDVLSRAVSGQVLPQGLMMVEAVASYANSPIQSIQQSIKDILLVLASKRTGFSYQNFTKIILEL